MFADGRRFWFAGVTCLLMSLTSVSCGQDAAAPRSAAAAVVELGSPAGPASGEPDWAVAGNELILSWVEKTASGSALKFSSYTNGQWTPARKVAEGSDWFVNWADFPSVLKRPDGTLAAHWLQMSGPGRYAYRVQIAQSSDGGKTWSAALTPHRDGTETEHGFVSLMPWAGGRTGAAWLDGRKFAASKSKEGTESGGEMTLRFAAFDAAGRLSEEAELDGRVCECCQTSAALTADGAIVVYRDRSPGEIRDIGYVLYRQGKWTAPRILNADNWEIRGCPVNGPSVAADGRLVVVAWFTGAQDKPRVQAIFSSDAGVTFGKPVEISSARPMGRVDVAMLGDGSAMVSWLEGSEQSALIQAMRVRPDGSRDPVITVRQTSASRKSGFPRMARLGQNVFFAWTEIEKPGEPARVRTAVWNIPN